MGKAWRQLCNQVPGNMRRAWFDIVDDPRTTSPRQHPLSGSLGTANIKGSVFEQWQYEVTGGGRLWYAIDDVASIVWLTRVAAGHPKQTERRNRHGRR
ncbi:hypothetical protein ACFQ07_28025 [Actinomadura adrarensis]|uniref:Type II toxin-antitoxin system RelE/ParE family toxin n=1 Tax=Actinomadura adrarensis TaxID=1819600 RepID=A0ABW3CQ65_9ACTN